MKMSHKVYKVYKVHKVCGPLRGAMLATVLTAGKSCKCTDFMNLMDFKNFMD